MTNAARRKDKMESSNEQAGKSGVGPCNRKAFKKHCSVGVWCGRGGEGASARPRRGDVKSNNCHHRNVGRGDQIA